MPTLRHLALGAATALLLGASVRRRERRPFRTPRGSAQADAPRSSAVAAPSARWRRVGIVGSR
jgi:hypothetical protein